MNDRGAGPRLISRRRFLGLGAAGAVALLVGCETEQTQREFTQGATGQTVGEAAGQASAGYDQRFRPQYHFSPEKNWMNDPNGLVYYEGRYHLFFQHNPKGNEWGNISWGHAVSNDLYHWEELPVALRPDDLGMAWSGSAVVDSTNSSGFFGSKDGLVAFYTNAEDTNEDQEGFEKQRQSLAYSSNQGREWTKYDDNPIIADPGIKDFRDPKVFWHEQSQKWAMVLVAGEKIMLYGSKNLKDWNKLSEFGEGQGAHGGVWETPDLFKLPVDGDPNNLKWVLTLGINPGAAEGGSGEQYFIGDFDGETFTNSNSADTILWADYGKDFYAAQSWSNIPAEDRRRVWVGWMSNWQYAQEIPTSPWRSAMSVPRVLTLTDVPGEGIRLVQTPAEQLRGLRTKTREFRDVVVDSDGGSLPQELGDTLGRSYELVAEFEPNSAGEFGFEIRKNSDSRTVVGYDVQNSQMFVDRSNSGQTDFSEKFPGKHEAPLNPNQNGKVKMRILVDRSSVEVFGGGGITVVTDQIFPAENATGLSLYAKGGSARLVSLEAHHIESVWT